VPRLVKQKNPTPPDSHPELPTDPDIILPRIRRPIHLVQELELTVFIGGCLGALSRYGITLQYPSKGGAWPTATFIVNMVGAFVLGLLLESLAQHGKDVGLRRLLRLGIGTGFIGAFTTYSTLAIDADLLVRRNHFALALAYTVISVAGGLILSALGIQFGTAYHRKQSRQRS
jgi:CrcB protein